MKMNCETIHSYFCTEKICFLGLKLYMNLFYRFCICMAASAKNLSSFLSCREALFWAWSLAGTKPNISKLKFDVLFCLIAIF